MNVPIRVRMTAWYVVLLALVLVAIGTFLAVRLRADLIGSIDRSLRPDTAQIARDYRAEGLPEFADAARTVLTGERAAAQVLGPGGRTLVSFGDEIAAAPMLDRTQQAAAAAGEQLLLTRDLGPQERPFRITAVPVRRDGTVQIVVAGQSLEPVERSVRRLVLLLLLAGPAALLATALGGWWLAGRALRPVEEMTSTAAAIGVDRLGERVPEPLTRDELSHLARTLNAMLDRIEGGVADQRRLVADASHELRTPLAAMRSEIDVSLRADDLPPAAREVLLSAREEVDGLSRTVDDLLTLAALDDGVAPVRDREADLAVIAADVIGTLTAQARARGVRVEQRGTPALAPVDEPRIARAIRNVVENAIAFSPEGGTVTLTTSVSGATARMVVEDDGPGIAPADRERIFERFYRADASRNRATGGSGLGLAITREIVEAHGGAVRVEPRLHGSTLVIEVPQ